MILLRHEAECHYHSLEPRCNRQPIDREDQESDRSSAMEDDKSNDEVANYLTSKYGDGRVTEKHSK